MSLPEYRCPRCHGRAEIRPRSWGPGEGSRPGNVLACCDQKCDTWVAVHTKTMRPMGRMAGRVTRAKRRDAHRAIDPLWLELGLDREEVYGWIADHLAVRHERAHIGWLSDDQLDEITVAARRKQEDVKNARSAND
jgi:hypothetical protein